MCDMCIMTGLRKEEQPISEEDARLFVSTLINSGATVTTMYEQLLACKRHEKIAGICVRCGKDIDTNGNVINANQSQNKEKGKVIKFEKPKAKGKLTSALV